MASERKQRDHQPIPERTPGEPRLRVASTAARPTRPMTNSHDDDGRTLQALLALSDILLAHLSLDDLLPSLLDPVRMAMQAESAAIWLLNDDEQALELRAARGPGEELAGQAAIPVGVGFVGQIAARRAPLAVDALSTAPDGHPPLWEGFPAALGAPLLAGDRLLGVLAIGSATPRQFTAADTALLQQIAGRIALAVGRAQHDAAAEAARRAAEQRVAFLNTTLEAIGDGLVISDAQGRVQYGNPAFSALMGGAPDDPDEPDDAGVSPIGESVRLRRLDVRDIQGNPLANDELAITRALRGETLAGSDALEVRIRRRDGQDAYLSVSSAPLRDEDGGIVGAVCLYRDLTERQELNNLLRQRSHDLETANARLRTLVEVLPVGAAIVDATGKAMLINDAIRQIWGQHLPLAESAAQYGEYRAWRTDTGQRIAADEFGLAQALSAGTVSVGVEYDIETFDGRRKTILDSAAPLRDEAGAIIGAVSVIFDITEQKRRTERTREALEAFIAITRALVEAPDEADETASGATDAGGEGAPGLQEESPVARRLAELTRGILGCSRVSISAVEGEPMLARPVTVVGLSPEQERQWWTEQQALPPGEGLIPEDRERLLAGEVITLDLTRPPYLIPNAYGVTSILVAAMRTQGRLVGVLALDFLEPSEKPHVFTPEEIQIAAAVARLGAVVLERDRLLREREAARAQALALSEANRRMDEFLGIAGHELRTPLTTVKANLQLAERRARRVLQIQSQEDAAEAREAGKSGQRDPLQQLLRLLDQATVSVERQERLVLDLLDVSRISAGRLEYRMARQNLTTLVEVAVEEQRIAAPGRRITLETPSDPVYVDADADRIGQVMANYLTNALKYSGSEQPVVVTLRMDDAFARVEVRDQGPGLSAEQQRRLFERFYQAPGVEVISGSGVGLGLGLYISKTIVEQHSGAVGVESATGVGSAFWFTLPLA